MQRRTPQWITLAGLLGAACPPSSGQVDQHGWDAHTTCANACVGDAINCELVFAYDDDYGDTLEIQGAYFILDPLGGAYRVPDVGDLEVIQVLGNAIALGAGGGFPVRIGDSGSTLGGLPGDPQPGAVILGHGSYVVQPDDPEVLGVVGWILARDLCDDPDTDPCFSSLVWRQVFADGIEVSPMPDVSIVNETGSRPGVVEHVASVPAGDGSTDYWWSIQGGTIIDGEYDNVVVYTAQSDTVHLQVEVFTGSGCFDTGSIVIVIRPDIDRDGAVGVADLLAVISAWGTCPAEPPCPADVNGDGFVDTDDLGIVLMHWE